MTRMEICKWKIKIECQVMREHRAPYLTTSNHLPCPRIIMCGLARGIVWSFEMQWVQTLGR